MRIRTVFITVMLIWGSLTWSAEIDVEAAQKGSALTFVQEDLRRVHRQLFADKEVFVPLVASSLAQEFPQQWSTALASRLFRVPGQNATPQRVQLDRELRLAILREFRYLQPLGLGRLYSAFVQQENDTRLVTTALIDSFTLAPNFAAEIGVKLSGADAENVPPTSADPGVRRLALELLVYHRGVGDKSVERALRQALLYDDFGTTRAALALLQPGERIDLVTVALHRLLPALERGPGHVAWPAFLMALDRSLMLPWDPLLDHLVGLALQDQRPIAAALSAAVSKGRVHLRNHHVHRFAAALNQTTDVPKRNALLSMILHHSPRLVIQMMPSDSVWYQMAQHRLEAFE